MIKDRWERRYINDQQLKRMRDLTIITEAQFDELWAGKYPPQPQEEELPPAPEELPNDPVISGEGQPGPAETTPSPDEEVS